MSDEKASVPERGEQMTFEVGDCAGLRERVTIRVSEIHPEGRGYITLVGYRIGAAGFPEADLSLCVPVATVEARRLHRR